MARVVRQPLPDPPAVYDQAYFFRVINALNIFMLQSTAPAEWIAASYICTSPVIVDPTGTIPNSVPDTSSLPNGMLYLYKAAPPVGEPGAFYVSIVTEHDT
jgi:hypothetical protein